MKRNRKASVKRYAVIAAGFWLRRQVHGPARYSEIGKRAASRRARKQQLAEKQTDMRHRGRSLHLVAAHV